jgi:hypothetical protein
VELTGAVAAEEADDLPREVRVHAVVVEEGVVDVEEVDRPHVTMMPG